MTRPILHYNYQGKLYVFEDQCTRYEVALTYNAHEVIVSVIMDQGYVVRITRYHGDPVNAILYKLMEAGMNASDAEAVAKYVGPKIDWDSEEIVRNEQRVLMVYVGKGKGLREYLRALLAEYLKQEDELK